MNITNNISSVDHPCGSGIGYSFVFYLAGLDTCLDKEEVDLKRR